MAAVFKNDCFTKKLIEDVQLTFNRLETALKARETQLLRQIDVILQQYTLNKNTKCFNKIKVIFNNEVDILRAVSNFGLIDFEGINLENNIYQIEEYENPNCDHVCMHKCLKKIVNAPDVVPNKTQTEPAPSTQSIQKVNDEVVNLKISSDVIVQNLQLYASTLKSMQSSEDLNSIKTNMEIKISEPLSALKHQEEIADNLNNSNSTASFEFHEASSLENSIDQLNESSTSLINSTSNINSSTEHSSFEFHESSFESKNSGTNTTNIPTIKIESSKNFYNRHDSRYAKISTSNLIETVGEDLKDGVSKEELETVENNVNEINNELNTENNNQTQNMNLEHPIQQWMQQISREPEVEPIQNNEMMEHVNISTTL